MIGLNICGVSVSIVGINNSINNVNLFTCTIKTAYSRATVSLWFQMFLSVFINGFFFFFFKKIFFLYVIFVSDLLVFYNYLKRKNKKVMLRKYKKCFLKKKKKNSPF